MTTQTHTLTDPRELAASAPYAYFLPCPAQVQAVAAGDVVKLVFEYTEPTENWSAERMWVLVETANGDRPLRRPQ